MSTNEKNKDLSINAKDKDTTVQIENYREVLSQSHMKDAEIKTLKESLHDVEYMLERINAEKVSVVQADVDIGKNLLVSIGKYTMDELKDKTPATIFDMAEVALRNAQPSYVSILRQREADQNKPPVLGTVGAYNQNTGKFEGGITA